MLLAALALVAGCSQSRGRAAPVPLPEQVSEPTEQDPQKILVDSAGDLDPSMRARALHWLIRTSPDPAGGEWGPRACYDPSAWVQRGCVNALKIRGSSDTAAVELLAEITALGQADPYVRATAAIALARIGDSQIRAEAYEALDEAWRAETEAWIVAPLALGTAALDHNDAAVDALSSALATGEVGLEATFIEQVGQSGHSGLTTGLQQALDFGEDILANQIAIALIALGDPSGEQVIRKALEHPDPEIRYHAAEVAADLDHPSTRALLKRAEQDNVASISVLAQLALAARSGQSADSFSDAMQSSDREVRALAAIWTVRALAHPVGGENKKLSREAPQLLAQAISDGDSFVVRATLFALADSPEGLAPPSGVSGLCLHESDAIRIEAAGLTLERSS